MYSSRMKLYPKRGFGFSEFDSEKPPSGQKREIYILAGKIKPPAFEIQVGSNIFSHCL